MCCSAKKNWGEVKKRRTSDCWWKNYPGDQARCCWCNRTTCIHKVPAFQQKVLHQRSAERGNALCMEQIHREKMWRNFLPNGKWCRKLVQHIFQPPLCPHGKCVWEGVCTISVPFLAPQPTAGSLAAPWKRTHIKNNINLNLEYKKSKIFQKFSVFCNKFIVQIKYLIR